MKQPAAALLLLLAAAPLAGCDGKSVPRALLAGGWAPPGQACDSARGVFYDKGGTWAGYNVVGVWKLAGDRLTTRITERGGYDRPALKVTGEKPSTATIVSLTPTELGLRLADGSSERLQRCK